MALPAHVLDRLPPELLKRISSPLSRAGRLGPARCLEEVLALSGLEGALGEGGLVRGGVVELALQGAAAWGTSLSLGACRAAQVEARALGGESAWCAFLDPSSSLHAPGVARAGVELERLLLVRPTLEALGRTALRVVESKAFAVVVIDTVGSAAKPLDVSLGPWARLVRRLSLAVEGTRTTVLLLTDCARPRPLTLPVAQRLELSRKSEHELFVAVTKDRQGRTSSARRVPLAALRGPVSAERSSAERGPSRPREEVNRVA